MTEEAFLLGMSKIIANFPNLNPPQASLKIWKELLDDLSDAEFLRGVDAFCRTKTELYPGTNLVASIHSALQEDLTGTELFHFFEREKQNRELRAQLMLAEGKKDGLH